MSGREGCWLTVLSCAVLILGTGCSSDVSTDNLPPPATLATAPTGGPVEDSDLAEDSEPAETSDPAETGSSTETSDPSAGPDAEFTPEELAAALATVNEKKSLEAIILTDSDIREFVGDTGSENRAEPSISPEECNVFADPELTDQALNAALSAMTFAGASSLQPDSISLTSHTSDEVIQDQLDINRDQLADCSEFEMDIAGETVAVGVTELPVTTVADEAFAVQTVVQVPGTIRQTISLTAVTGTTTINVIVGSSGDSVLDLARGQDLVDSTVSALRGL